MQTGKEIIERFPMLTPNMNENLNVKLHRKYEKVFSVVMYVHGGNTEIQLPQNGFVTMKKKQT